MNPINHLSSLDPSICDAWLGVLRKASNWRGAEVIQLVEASEIWSGVKSSQRNADILQRKNNLRIYGEFDKILSDIAFEFLLKFEKQSRLSLSGTQLVRYRPGGFFAPHRDNNSIIEDRIFTIIIYLNDDFVGGETCLDELGDVIAPIKGRVLIFASDIIHSARPVSSGIKYVVVAWLTIPQIHWI